MNTLSRRLSCVAGMVTPGNRVADIGTDHAFLPILLVQEKKIPSAIAMDIGEGPLSRAREHIEKEKLTKQIETRLSDGLSAFCPNEADSIVIAGMGGSLITRILTEGRDKLSSVKELVLSPQSEVPLVRNYLIKSGLYIDKEAFIEDMGKYYSVFHVCVKHDDRNWSTEELSFGKLPLYEGNETLRQFLTERIAKKESLYQSLTKRMAKKESLYQSLRESESGSKERTERRALELEEELERMKNTLQRLSTKCEAF